MARVFAILSWLGVALVAMLHIAFWRGAPLAGLTLAGLVLGFGLAIVVLLALILAVQRAADAPQGGPGAAYFAVVPRWGRWVLMLGFLYVAMHFVDWLPIGGHGRGGVDPSAFERAFSAIIAWQLLAAALYHTYVPRAAQERA